MPRAELHALVPNADRTAFLVDDEGRLPSVVVDVETRVIPAAIAAFADLHRLDAPFLRVARWADDYVPLLEFDAPVSTPDGRWRELDALAEVAPAAFAEDVARWAREQRDGVIPDLRSPWARPGWLEEATRWIGESVAVAGIESFRRWPLSAVLVVTATSGQRLYFKAAFRPFAHEPLVTQALGDEHPGLVPDVVAVDVDRGWMLMRELPGTADGVDRPDAAMRALAAIHRAWSGRTPELRALGAHDRRLRALDEELPRIVDLLGGPPDSVALFRARISELAARMPGETLVHGDFHPWNVSVDGDRLVVFDWSDACVAHPLFDLPTFVHVGERLTVDVVEDAYARARDDLDPGSVREAFALAYPLACVHHAISYHRIEKALEPADRGLFGNAPREWLDRALAAG